MEYTQWVEKKEVVSELLKNVLILVVMEYTQWVLPKDNYVSVSLS